MKKNWFELGLYNHWSEQPHGIARVTLNLFIASLSDKTIEYFYYSQKKKKFIKPFKIDYFIKLSKGNLKYKEEELPDGIELESEIGFNDKIMITGAGWGYENYLSELKLIKNNKKAKLSCIIYDIIAIHSPHFFLEEFADLVGNFQRELMQLVDHVACISKNTENDVINYLTNWKNKTSSVFKMGSDFPITKKKSKNKKVNAILKKDFILSVGTVEARKNHLLLYYVIKKLVLKLGLHAPHLVIVGNQGWLTENVVEFIKRDPDVKDKIHILNSIDDSSLEELYKTCLFTIYPSFYEGYGLPILESFGRRKVCICSNTSSMLEITPFKDLTFDPYDPEHAYAVVYKTLNKKFRNEREAKLAKFDFSHKWKDSYNELATWFRD